MSSTLTPLIRPMFQALNIVSREKAGFIPAVSRNSGVERAALNQTVSVPIAPAVALADNTPATTAPNTGDTVATTVDRLRIAVLLGDNVTLSEEDLKGIAALFASDACAHITGQIVVVDGGACII